MMGNENQIYGYAQQYGQDTRQVHRCLRSPGNRSSSSGSSYIVYPAGYGDEGKWVWMARISGQMLKD